MCMIAKNKIPRILSDYLYQTGQMAHWPLSDEHLLKEAEWQLYQCGQESSGAYEYPHQSKAALRRFVERLRNEGVEPKHDFEI